MVSTGRIYPIKEKPRHHRPRWVGAKSSQMIKRDADREGNLVVANVAFVAEKVPSVGYDTYFWS